MPLAAGQTLTHYEILGPLGAGGMGEVYRARDTRLEREVAIKVLPEHLADDEERLRRFEREAKTLASLNHPNVAGIHGIDQVGDTCFLAMELVPGEDLAARLARGPLPVAEALDVGRQIAEGLEAAHEAGVVHRDLKPANVRITPEGAVKLLDFGLAKPMHPGARRSSGEGTTTAESDSLVVTEEGLVLGTPTYMSPEQARGKPVDRRTDIWAFGCVLYECLTGKRAFGGGSVTDVLAAIVEREPDWRALPGATPAHVRSLLRRSLVKEPRQRLRDVGEARLELEGGGAAREGELATEDASRARSANRLAGALALVAIVSLLLAGQAWLRTPVRSEPEVLRFTTPIPPEASKAFGQTFAFSPDGRTLVYRTLSADGTYGLRVRDLREVQSRWIPEAVIGAVSPDGGSLAYVTLGEELKVGPLRGGAARTVTIGVSGLEGLAWGEDGHLYYTPRGAVGLSRIPAAGGGSSPVLDVDPKAQATSGIASLAFDWPRSADVLPGGNRILVTYVRTPGTPPDIVAVDLQSGRRSTLVQGTQGWFTSGFLVFVDPSGALLLAPFDPERLELLAAPQGTGITVETDTEVGARLAVSRRGDLVYVPGAGKNTQLVLVDRKGNETPLEVDLPGNVETVAFDPTGERIALGIREDRRTSIWVHGMADGTLSRLTFEGVEVWRPSWSPDGSRVAYVSDRGRSDGLRSIWIQPADGSDEPELLVESPRLAQELTWSADGAEVAYREGFDDGGNMRDIWVLRSGEDTTPRPFATTQADELMPRLSPDGRFLAYVSDESGSKEVYVRPFPSGAGRWQITTDGGDSPVWRRDGKELFYVRRDSILVAVPVLEGPSFVTGPHEELFSTRRYVSEPNTICYDVAPDGERFLEIEQVDLEMVTVVNWIEEARRLFDEGE